MKEYIDRKKVEKAINQHRCDTSRIEEAILHIPSANVIPIPEGATNGDMIKTMFNCMVIGISNGKVYVEHIYFPFDEEWWNAPYKPESEGKE